MEVWMLKSIKVMGKVVKIKYVDRSVLDKMITNAEGIWDSYTETIFIYKKAPKAIQEYYIYHEAGHALLTYTGLDQVINPDMQEVLVQSYATFIRSLNE